MAKVVMTQLIKKGKVSRGWLGVSIQEITPELAKKLNLKDAKGVLVTDVTEGGPAAKAGIQSGDTIVMFDEKEVADPSSLKNMVGNTVSGKQVSVKYVRSGSLATVKVTIQTFPEDQKKLASSLDNQLKGVAVQNITPDVRKSLNLPPRVTGVVVIDIMEGTPAADILTPGDIIMEINRKKIVNVGEYEAVVASFRASQNILLLIYRNGAGLFVTL